MVEIAGMSFKDVFLRRNICLPATEYAWDYWGFGPSPSPCILKMFRKLDLIQFLKSYVL